MLLVYFSRRSAVCDDLRPPAACAHPSLPTPILLQGPALFGVVGRVSGTAENYAYSKANKEKAVEWTEEALYEYLLNPKKYIPGALPGSAAAGGGGRGGCGVMPVAADAAGGDDGPRRRAGTGGRAPARACLRLSQRVRFRAR